MSNKHTTVAEMTAEYLGDAAAQEISRQQQDSGINLWLASLRMQSGLSIEELAKRLGVTVDEVRLIEESTASEISVANMIHYMAAAGNDVEILATPRNKLLAERVHAHLHHVEQQLASIVQLVGTDAGMRAGLADLLGQIVHRFSQGIAHAMLPLGPEFMLQTSQRFTPTTPPEPIITCGVAHSARRTGKKAPANC